MPISSMATGRRSTIEQMTPQQSTIESTSTTNETASDLTQSETFDILSNHRRRYVLHYLKCNESGRVTLRELTRQVAAWENGVSTEEVTSKQRKRIHNSLQQYHLPKMQRTGIIEYDETKGIIGIEQATESLDIYLDITESDIPWGPYYAGLSVMSIATVTVAVLNVPPFTLLPGIGWAFLIAVVLFLSSVIHIYRSRKLRVGSAGPPPELRENT